MNNLHNNNVPLDVVSQAEAKVSELTELLKPFLTQLKAEDRQYLPKMGDKTLSFVTKANEFAGQNPHFLPSFINKENFDVDIAGATGLIRLISLLDQLSGLVEDTRLLAGSEAYTAALSFYNNVKLAAKQNVHGAEVIYNELKQRFPGRGRKSQEK